MEAPTTFHLFSKLPAELRLRIWEFNLPAWRIVPLRCGSDISAPPPPPPGPDPEDTTNQSLTTTGRRPIDCSSSAPIPANLHTCVESRTQALSHYSLSFSFARQPPHVFFDPRTDILYFGPRHDGYMAANAQFHTAMSLIRPDHLAAARRIAVDDALFQVLSPPSTSSSSSSSSDPSSSTSPSTTPPSPFPSPPTASASSAAACPTSRRSSSCPTPPPGAPPTTPSSSATPSPARSRPPSATSPTSSPPPAPSPGSRPAGRSSRVPWPSRVPVTLPRASSATEAVEP
uniref:2EXR domain-containing protein n=1 Tax=Bionectria ochroleuca TaxID=29856 RepID=A0A8H7K303_BIOOC